MTVKALGLQVRSMYGTVPRSASPEVCERNTHKHIFMLSVLKLQILFGFSFQPPKKKILSGSFLFICCAIEFIPLEVFHISSHCNSKLHHSFTEILGEKPVHRRSSKKVEGPALMPPLI